MPWVCSYCGSTEVYQDANVDPNNNNAVITVYANAYCEQCGGETRLEWRDDEPSDTMDGDHESALASAGFGTDEDYGGTHEDC